MKNSRISANEAKDASLAAKHDLQEKLNQIFSEIRLKSGLGYRDFLWPIHTSILDEVVSELRQEGYIIEVQPGKSEEDRVLINIKW